MNIFSEYVAGIRNGLQYNQETDNENIYKATECLLNNHYESILAYAYWQGYLIAIGGKEYLTPNQLEVLAELVFHHHYYIAATTKKEWLKGREYYIDSRTKIKGIRELRRKFEQGNREAIELYSKRMESVKQSSS